MKRQNGSAFVVIITLILGGTGVWYHLNYQPACLGIHESIVVGTTVQELAAQSNQDACGILTCRYDWIASYFETANRFFESLPRHEAYAINHPSELKAIVQKRLNYGNNDIFINRSR